MNQFGYARLTHGTILLVVVLIPVLIYQFVVFRDREARRPDVAVPTAIQLFPQSLPVETGVQYELEVIDDNQRAYALSRFFHREENFIIDNTGNVITNGIVELPPDAGEIRTANLYIFDDSDPADRIRILFLTGDISDDRAILTFRPADFSEAGGEFMLASPTDNNSLVNERSGLWFGHVLQNSGRLTLPALSDGWVYEGWAIIDGRTLTTGRFARSDEPDLFAGFSDDQARSPSFPGEDFLLDPPVRVFPDLQFPVDLAGQEVMITVEPDHGGTDPTGQEPFATTILSADIPRLAEAGRLYEMEQDTVGLPKATVVLR